MSGMPSNACDTQIPTFTEGSPTYHQLKEILSNGFEQKLLTNGIATQDFMSYWVQNCARQVSASLCRYTPRAESISEITVELDSPEADGNLERVQRLMTVVAKPGEPGLSVKEWSYTMRSEADGVISEEDWTAQLVSTVKGDLEAIRQHQLSLLGQDERQIEEPNEEIWSPVFLRVLEEALEHAIEGPRAERPKADISVYPVTTANSSLTSFNVTLKTAIWNGQSLVEDVFAADFEKSTSGNHWVGQLLSVHDTQVKVVEHCLRTLQDHLLSEKHSAVVPPDLVKAWMSEARASNKLEDVVQQLAMVQGDRSGSDFTCTWGPARYWVTKSPGQDDRSVLSLQLVGTSVFDGQVITKVTRPMEFASDIGYKSQDVFDQGPIPVWTASAVWQKALPPVDGDAVVS